MIQNNIENSFNDNLENSSSIIDLILQEPVYSLMFGLIIGSIVTYFYMRLFVTKNNLSNFNLTKNLIETNDNFGGLFQNLSDSDKCKGLYKSLMTRVHPDKFIGTEKEERVLELAQELGKFKQNYKKLKEIEKLISDEFK